MPNEPIWLPRDEVLELNKDLVSRSGEGHSLLRPDLLESALARPQNHYAYEGEGDILQLAVTLMFGIARNHPFEQGNKRTGFIAGIMFLRANGYDYPLDPIETAENFIKVVAGEMDEATFAYLIASDIVEIVD